MREHDSTDDHPQADALDVRRRQGFGIVAASVLDDTRLPPVARLLYAVLATYAGQDRSAFPGKPLLADRLGISVASVKRALRTLEDAGVLDVERRREGSVHHPNRYWLNDLLAAPRREGWGHPRPGGGVTGDPRVGSPVNPEALPTNTTTETPPVRGASHADARERGTTGHPQVRPQPVHHGSGVPAGTCPDCYLPEHDGRCAPVRSTGRPPDFRAQVAAAAADPDRPRTTTRRPPPLPDLPQPPTEEPTP